MAALSGVHPLNPYGHHPALHPHLPLSMFTPPSIPPTGPGLSSLPPPAPPTPTVPIGASAGSSTNGPSTTPGVTGSAAISTPSSHVPPLAPFLPGASTESLLQSQDLLRRELDARFLASQDRSIAIPPPPYMRPSPSSGSNGSVTSSAVANSSGHINGGAISETNGPNGPLLPTTVPPLFDPKLSKLDPLAYSRSMASLLPSPSGPPGAGLLGPPPPPPPHPHPPSAATGLGITSANGSSSGLTSTTTASGPFGSPGHTAAFQPKTGPTASGATISISATKCKGPIAKAGRWCAMHVRVSIYLIRYFRHLS